MLYPLYKEQEHGMLISIRFVPIGEKWYVNYTFCIPDKKTEYIWGNSLCRFLLGDKIIYKHKYANIKKTIIITRECTITEICDV